MPRQISLDLCGDGLDALWRRVPERCRRDVVAIWTQLLARAARDRFDTSNGQEERR